MEQERRWCEVFSGGTRVVEAPRDDQNDDENDDQVGIGTDATIRRGVTHT